MLKEFDLLNEYHQRESLLLFKTSLEWSALRRNSNGESVEIQTLENVNF